VDLGRSDDTQRYYSQATLREIAHQTDYRQRASKVLTALPSGQATALASLWQSQAERLLSTAKAETLYIAA